MAPLSKDTLEVAVPAGEPAASQASGQSSSGTNQLQKDALSLEVPVRIHGSRVTESVRGVTPHTEPFEEQTETMIVFRHGAVVKMNTAVNSGQMLVLTNLKTRQDAICRVVKVRPNANFASYVEVEFSHKQPGYWGDAFPADEPPVVVKPAPPVAPPEPKKVAPLASDISWAPASSIGTTPPKPPVRPAPPVKPASAAKPEQTFISIGTQEEVQPAASATATTRPLPHSEPDAQPSISPVARTESLIESEQASLTIASPAPSLSDLQGDQGPASPALFAAASVAETDTAETSDRSSAASPSDRVFGRFSGAEHRQSAAAEDFGARLGASIAEEPEHAPESKGNWTLIAAGVAVIVAALAGGVYYVRSHSGSAASSARSSAPVSRPAVPAPSGPAPAFAAAGQPGAPVASVAPSKPSNAPSSAPAAAPVKPANAPGGVQHPEIVAIEPGASPPSPAPSAAVASKAPAPKVTPDMMSGALNAHPTAPQRADAGPGDEPSIQAHPELAAADSDALAGLSSTANVSIPPPTIQPEGPVRTGGQVSAPKLISSAMPIYPAAAKKAGIDGDVVVEATVDKDGNISQMQVISGPSLLRQAALDALRKWKYEPSKLDGQPVSVQMRVTIKFKR